MKLKDGIELTLEMKKRIRERQKELHLTQSDVAHRANGMSVDKYKNITRLKDGNKKISILDLISISNALNCTSDYIRDFSDDPLINRSGTALISFKERNDMIDEIVSFLNKDEEILRGFYNIFHRAPGDQRDQFLNAIKGMAYIIRENSLLNRRDELSPESFNLIIDMFKKNDPRYTKAFLLKTEADRLMYVSEYKKAIVQYLELIEYVLVEDARAFTLMKQTTENILFIMDIWKKRNPDISHLRKHIETLSKIDSIFFLSQEESNTISEDISLYLAMLSGNTHKNKNDV